MEMEDEQTQCVYSRTITIITVIMLLFQWPTRNENVYGFSNPVSTTTINKVIDSVTRRPGDFFAVHGFPQKRYILQIKKTINRKHFDALVMYNNNIIIMHNNKSTCVTTKNHYHGIGMRHCTQLV